MSFDDYQCVHLFRDTSRWTAQNENSPETLSVTSGSDVMFILGICSREGKERKEVNGTSGPKSLPNGPSSAAKWVGIQCGFILLSQSFAFFILFFLEDETSSLQSRIWDLPVDYQIQSYMQINKLSHLSSIFHPKPDITSFS